jgi:hypothetical protein
MITISIEGLEQLKSDFVSYEKASGKAVKKVVNDTSNAVRKDAVSRLKGMFGSAKHWVGGTLASSIYNKRDVAVETHAYTKLVGTHEEYAPYIEFGTGDLVFENFEFSEEAKTYAAQYKGKGIRKVNIRGDSFLNWAAVNQAKKFRERVIEELNKIKK